MWLDDFGHDLVMSTLAGALVTTGERVRGVAMTIQCHNLLVLPMREFDAIFGINWMTRCRALIDYQEKKVQL